ncbi:soluble scavenger receptor cysteine-rich domain-containing protein SSC5D [Vespula squamosa]|uniref:Soluble scavenger receptor cysteine-rich domain-containing protein SSC5D n=1 Tax=Vespula squamosa TaxID=30214 RepID=A0ABD2BYZ4_VESSQ
MRFLLLTVLCSVAALTAAIEKSKRDILPGDLRYGTDYHNHHHHQENELEVSRSLGGYVGSYSVSNDEIKQSYGPPDYQPGKPLSTEQYTTIVKNNPQVPVPSYGIPEVNQVQTLNKQYLSPVIDAAKKVQLKTLTTLTKPVETTLLKKENADYLAPSVKAPVTSYGEPVTTVEIKTAGNSQESTSHVVPEVKTSAVPLLDTKVEQTVLPKIHDHLEGTKTQVKTQLTVPQVSDVGHQTSVVDSSLLFPVNDAVTSLNTNTDFSNLAPLTVDQSNTFVDHLRSQPDFDTAYQFNLRSGSFGNQQKLLNAHLPNLYVSPYTYGVSYQFPHSLYTSQVHQSLPSQLNNLVPYPLAGNNHLLSNVKVREPGSIRTFFQETFPSLQFPQFPQLSQLPQFPNLGSLFQLPTPAPTSAPENLEVVEGKKLETTDHLLDNKPVTLDTSLIKTSTVVTKTSNGYTQPVNENGAYVY